MSRTILVDDTDPGITYTGPWFADHGSKDSLGNFGVPYLSTLHGTTSDASFSYTFQGTLVSISGTQQYENTSAVTNPSWECIVDNKSVAVQTYSYANNRLSLCEQDGLTDGTHTITVKAHISDQRTFWFDYISYQPSASVPLDQAALSIPVPEPQMQFGLGWATYFPGYKTSTQGSTFRFDFNGISLTWLGFYDAQLPFAATTGAYTIDGGTPITFNLNGVAATATAVQYNQILFTTSTLPAGPHTLEVTYQGNNLTTPLSLGFMIIQNGTSTTTVSSSGSSAISTSSAPANSSLSNQNSTHSTSHVGPIVGAVIGALALIIAAIFLFLFLRRRQKRSRQKETVEDFDAIDTGPIIPYSLDGGPLYTPLASAPNHGNSVVGIPVVGKHNVVAATASQQYAPSSSTDSYYTRRQDASFPSDVPTSSRLTPARNVLGMHAHNLSSTTNMSDGLSHSTGPSSTTRSEPVTGSITISQTQPSKGAPEVSPPRVTRDEDSGIRMRQTEEGESVVVLPPEYTVT